MATIALFRIGRPAPNAAVYSRVEVDCLSRRPPLLNRPHRVEVDCLSRRPPLLNRPHPPMVGTAHPLESRLSGVGTLLHRLQIFEAPRERLHDAPGRPSSADLVKQEAERRVADGTAPELLKTFGSELSEWLHGKYPDLPQMTPRSVENLVRRIWQQKRSDI